MKLNLNLNPKILLANQVVVLLARLVILITILHFVFVTSMVHAVVLCVSYLTIELMDLQLKYMLKNGVNDLLASLMPKEKPNLTVIDSEDDNITKNETSH